ncbi:MAG: SNF2-related protein [Prolixibacteraceae bacterium]
MAQKYSYKFRNHNIAEYCLMFASPKIIDRANEYFYHARVNGEVKVDEDSASGTYLVVGNAAVYHVDIEMLNNNVVEIYCDCPYDWDGMCKHEVAVLMHLDDHLANLKGPRSPSIKTNERIEQGTWAIDKFYGEQLERYARKNGLSELDFNKLQLRIDDIADHTVTLVVQPLIYNYYDKPRKLIITANDKKLILSCTCNQTAEVLCEHQIFALIKMAEEQFFLEFVSEKKRKEFIKHNISNLALTGKVAEKDFIQFFIKDESHIGCNVLPEYQGVQPVETTILKYIRDDFFKRTIASGYAHIDLPERPTEEISQSKYALGYVITHASNNKRFEVYPIAGKLNKGETAMISNFEAYNDLSSATISLSEEDEKLIQLSQKVIPEKIENYLHNKGVDLSDPQDINAVLERTQYLMQFLPSLFSQLSTQPYVFLREAEYYEFLNLKLRRQDLEPVAISARPANFCYRLTEDTLFMALEPTIEIDGEELDIYDSRIKIHNHFFVELEKTLYLMNGLHHAMSLKNALITPKIKMVKEHAAIFLEEYVVPLSKSFDIRIDQLTNYNMEELVVKPLKKKLFISGMGNFVLFKPVVEYEKNLEIEILRNGMPVSVHGHIIHKAMRDKNYEDDFIDFIRSLHPLFEKQFPQEFYHLKVENMINKFWFFDAFEKMKQYEVEVYGLNELKNFRYHPFRGKVSTNLKSGKDWFEADIDLAFGDNKVSLNDIRKALLKKERYVKLSDNSYGILPEEWLAKFERYLRVGELKDGKLRISKKKFPIIEELFEDINDVEVLRELADKREQMKSFEEIKTVRIPTGIQATLRDYQKEGYKWLCFLDEFNWGGILADDMGLGKTLQAITLLKKVSESNATPSLVVLPTTLIFNWENELKKFCPDLNVLFHYGLNRQKNTDHFKDYNVIVTSYGMVMNDIELLQTVAFNYIFLDESQAIKNPSSKRFKAVSLLKAKNRIAMTGTPIENNTFDLFAQMSFVNPGFLGSATHFRDHFSTPIDRDKDKERAAELQRIISPFVLRRTKEQVATELPPKTEDVIFCTMEDEQRKVYDAYRNKFRDQLLNKIEADGIEKSKMHVLEGLIKLRQICDSPALLADDENYGDDSVKIRELIRHITRKTAKHKIVIFSQFVKMLALLKTEIESLNIDYEYLDGKCTQKQRKESVERFQSDEVCRVFLISLKAGGMGINLTAADYVYIVDPWWNPAVENQAIDRCYRIGQDKKVFAYRMICKDTIEEKIIQYQQEKKAVAEGIIQTDENFMKQLTKEDVLSIFG